MTTATLTESIHLKRLREYNENWIKTNNAKQTWKTRWQVFGFKPKSLIEVERLSDNYFEQTIGGYQLIIHEIKFRWRSVNDHNGVPLQLSNADDSEIGSYGEWVDTQNYSATAYRIGTDWDKIPTLNWIYQFSTFFATCNSSSKEKTTKLALKKLEIYNLLLDSIGDLITMCNKWVNRVDLETPYNLKIGDVVWIQAFGRVRQGKIVSTMGSRFVVGYVTPSNPHELKYKVLPLSLIRILP